LNSITRKQLTGKVKIEHLLSTDLALKIAAIRETFEETGIQLWKIKNTNMTTFTNKV
jgi:ADP-ribose pyrophosphatase YjhB (NUDIX family)